jgi:hypothetical protein
VRVVVEQAKGMIAQRDGSEVDTALERPRSARSNRQPVQEGARRVVDGVLRV